MRKSLWCVLVGIILAIPGVPGPGTPLILIGLSLLGFQKQALAFILWCFNAVGRRHWGVKLVTWLKKRLPKDKSDKS